MKHLPSLFLVSTVLAAGCGEVDSIRVRVAFPDDTTEAATRALHFIVHAPETGSSSTCDALWTLDSSIFPNRSVVEYPNTNDIVAAPVTLAPYPVLTFLVFAHPTKDVSASVPIAGGCREVATQAETGEDVVLRLERAPAPPG